MQCWPLEVEFMSISYYGTGDSSAVKITKDMDLNVAGRDVIMVEDIVDTGTTLNLLPKYDLMIDNTELIY